MEEDWLIGKDSLCVLGPSSSWSLTENYTFWDSHISYYYMVKSLLFFFSSPWWNVGMPRPCQGHVSNSSCLCFSWFCASTLEPISSLWSLVLWGSDLSLFFMFSYQLRPLVPDSLPVRPMVPSSADVLHSRFLLKSLPRLALASLIGLDLGLNTTLWITLVCHWLVAKSNNSHQSSVNSVFR